MSSAEIDGFKTAIEPMWTSLGALASAGFEMVDGTQPQAESRAMAEFAQEARLGDSNWSEPIQHVQMIVGFNSIALLDHCRSYGLHFATEPIPLYSHFVVARAALDAGATAWWLLDSEIDAEQRAVRGQVLRLANAREAKRGPSDLEAMRTTAATVRQAVQAGAADRGLRVIVNKPRTPITIGKQEKPTPRQSIEAMLGYKGFPEISHVLWWLLSGYTHGGFYALAQSIGVRPTGEEMGLPMAGLVTDSRTSNLIGALVGKATTRVVQARNEYYGLESPAWDSAVSEFNSFAASLLGNAK
jgi:hypothetical protein